MVGYRIVGIDLERLATFCHCVVVGGACIICDDGLGQPDFVEDVWKSLGSKDAKLWISYKFCFSEKDFSMTNKAFHDQESFISD